MKNDSKTKMKLEKWILFDSVPIRMFKLQYIPRNMHTVLLCCALLWLYIDWFSHIHQAYSSASKATLMNMDKYFMWIHYERLHNHNKAKHNKTVCIFLGIYCR